MTEHEKHPLGGAHAILGFDVVSFSTLNDEDQLKAIDKLVQWTSEALAFHGVRSDDYRWSPAGDGGFLTFGPLSGCRKAIDVAFSIYDKLEHPDWRPNSGDQLQLRTVLHAGNVLEGRELGGGTNIWGHGINTTARMLTICARKQILVSQSYYDMYLRDQRAEAGFKYGELYCRTVKHGHQVKVMNVSRRDSGLSKAQAAEHRWDAIGAVWRRVKQEYRDLLSDAMSSHDPVAALAAAKFLLALNDEEPVHILCSTISDLGEDKSAEYPVCRHALFSPMPAHVMVRVLRDSIPRNFHANEVICEEGDKAESCFFPICGTIVVEGSKIRNPISIHQGTIIGEFALWIPNVRRTARLRALDDGLFLEIYNRDFADILKQHTNVADAVYGVIKQRILENVVLSVDLFPGLTARQQQILLDSSVTCEKLKPGALIDLTSTTYILFNGKICLRTEAAPFLISAERFGPDTPVGIVSVIGKPDGDVAEVVEESVVVKLQHETLLKLQQESRELRDAWSAICGRRLGCLRSNDLEQVTQ